MGEADKKKSVSESLGSIVFGDRLVPSSLELKMNVNSTCIKWCESIIPKRDGALINRRILKQYRHNWSIDGLPAGRTATLKSNSDTFYSLGFELGSMKDKKAYFNNVYDIEVQIHEHEGKYRIVGVLVWPTSLKSPSNTDCAPNPDVDSQLRLKGDSTTVPFYYSVTWIKTDISWGTRWDNYLYVFDPKIHWFSLVNSIVIVLFLTGMVSMVLLRALHKDIARYNSEEDKEDAQEDFGWKLVHADVFRPPNRFMLLSVFAGTGAQLFMMSGVTLLFAVLGFLSPSSRGSLSTVMLMFFVFFGSFSGYISARLYKMFGGEHWKTAVILTATLVPGIVFVLFIVLNFFLIGKHSSGAVPFPTLFALMAMWFLISTPLCFVGAFFGFRKPKLDSPVRTNQIPRQIPDQASMTV
ncbi:MAG: hypothetical protein SGCHY_004387 [Lobulomycetales sp.]